MRSMRERQWRERMVKPRARFAIRAWAFAAKRPWLYRTGTRIAVKAMRLFRGKRGRIQSLPLAGGWTGARDMTVPESSTFMAQWKAGRRR